MLEIGESCLQESHARKAHWLSGHTQQICTGMAMLMPWLMFGRVVMPQCPQVLKA